MWQLGILAALTYYIVLLKMWERALEHTFKEIKLDGAARSIRVMRWSVQPLVYLLILACGLNIPANYGVLTMSNRGVWVNLDIKGDQLSRSGYLLSDIASEAREIWVLEYDYEKARWALAKVMRDELLQIEMTGQITKNILNPEVKKNP